MPGPGEFEQLVQEDNEQANGHVNGTDNFEDAD